MAVEIFHGFINFDVCSRGIVKDAMRLDFVILILISVKFTLSVIM